jgi:two-component system CheB/CheR fusion protein
MTDAQPDPDRGAPATTDGNGIADELSAARDALAAAREALDETSRARASDREREDLLRDELQHRVRNMLALVRSIFARSVASSENIDDLAAHFEGRIDVLARYQLTRALELGGSAELETMIHDALQDYVAGADPRVTVEGPDVRFRHDAAQLLGLAIHELATNAVKFGALSSDDPRAAMAIRWTLAQDRVTIRWEESGVAVIGAAPPKTGFGHSLIRQGLPYQLGATTEVTLRPGGVVCTIEVPLSANVVPGRLGGAY